MARSGSVIAAGLAAIFLTAAKPLNAQSLPQTPPRSPEQQRIAQELDAIPQALAISPDGRNVAVGYHSGQIRLWDADTLKRGKTIEAFSKLVRHVEFSPDGRFVAATAQLEAPIRVWDVASGVLFRTYKAVGRTGYPFVFDARSGLLVGAQSDGVIAWKFDPRDADSEVRVDAAEWAVAVDRVVQSVALSPDGRYLAAGTASGEILFWTNEGGTGYTSWRMSGLVRPFKQLDWVTGLAFTPNARYLLATNRFGELLQYDLSSGAFSTPERQYPARYANAGRLALANGGRTLLTSGVEIGSRLGPAGVGPGIVEVWDLPLRIQRAAVRELSNSVWAVAHGDLLFIADGWWGLNVHELGTGALRTAGPRDSAPAIIRNPSLSRPRAEATGFVGESARRGNETIPTPPSGTHAGRARLESFDPKAISADGLTVSSCCERIAPAWATRSWSTGRLYFEAQLSMQPPSAGLHPLTDAGIVTTNLRQTGMFAAKGRPQAGFAYGVRAGAGGNTDAPKSSRLASDDVVGFALDIDAGRLHVHVNGTWLTDAPGRGNRWISIPPGWDYTASFSVAGRKSDGASVSEAWTANFGEKSFKFGPPPGFDPAR